MSAANKIFRIHGPYVSESEIEKVNSFLRSQGKPDYIDEITANQINEKSESSGGDVNDELYESALKIVQTEKKASTSFLQRKLQIGYNRAARIIDQMEDNGVVSKANHVGKERFCNFLLEKILLSFLSIYYFCFILILAKEVKN